MGTEIGVCSRPHRPCPVLSMKPAESAITLLIPWSLNMYLFVLFLTWIMVFAMLPVLGIYSRS